MTGNQFADPNREAVGLEPAWAEGSGGDDTSAGSGPTAAKDAGKDADAGKDTGKDEPAKAGKGRKAAGRD